MRGQSGQLSRLRQILPAHVGKPDADRVHPDRHRTQPAAHRPIARWKMQKARPNEPGFFLDAYATLHDGYSTLYATLYADSELLRLRHQGLERLVGLLGEIGIE